MAGMAAVSENIGETVGILAKAKMAAKIMAALAAAVASAAAAWRGEAAAKSQWQWRGVKISHGVGENISVMAENG
jgi:hypothetical protein